MAAKKPLLRAKQYDSIKDLKKSLKRKTSGYTTRPPKDGSIVVRFLEEPDVWIEYYQYFDENDKKFYVETEGAVLPKGQRSSKRYLANAVDTEESKVIALEIPGSVANTLMKYYDKYSTIMDRDYEISREGTGLETEYTAMAESPSKMSLKRFDKIDLWPILEGMVPGADDDDEDDDDDDDDEMEDERPTRRPKPSSGKVKKRPEGGRRRPKPDDDDDDEDDAPPVKKKPVKRRLKK